MGIQGEDVMNREQALKACLYDLQHHNCNGVLSFRSDGMPEGKNCDYCAETIRLTNELHDLARTDVSNDD